MSISNIDIKQKKQYVHLKKKKKGVSLTCVMMYFAVTGSISPTLRRLLERRGCSAGGSIRASIGCRPEARGLGLEPCGCGGESERWRLTGCSFASAGPIPPSSRRCAVRYDARADWRARYVGLAEQHGSLDARYVMLLLLLLHGAELQEGEKNWRMADLEVNHGALADEWAHRRLLPVSTMISVNRWSAAWSSASGHQWPIPEAHRRLEPASSSPPPPPSSPSSLADQRRVSVSNQPPSFPFTSGSKPMRVCFREETPGSYFPLLHRTGVIKQPLSCGINNGGSRAVPAAAAGRGEGRAHRWCRDGPARYQHAAQQRIQGERRALQEIQVIYLAV